MSSPDDPIYRIATQDTVYPLAVRRLKGAEAFLMVIGVGGTILQHGLHNLTKIVQWELGAFVVVSMLGLSGILALRYHWSLAKPSFFRRHRAAVTISVVWLAGTVGLLAFTLRWNGEPISRPYALLLFSELCIVLRAVFSAILFTRRSTARMRSNPALLLVGSFVVLVTVGTILLMLPKAYADAATLEEPFLYRFRVALFTATSASCVTGLVLVDTGGPNAYWSPMGQMVILGLIQMGGLGIMTCGAFFAVISGRSMKIRESAALHEVLEAGGLDKVRRLIIGIFGLTLITELSGALLLSTLWADLPLGQRVFYSVFHSVSAFCNAGFSLTPDSFVGMATHWQIWGVIPALVIFGGLGFSVLYNISVVFFSNFRSPQKSPLFNLSRTRTHLSISSRIVLSTTAILLVVGMVSYYILEYSTTPDPRVASAAGELSQPQGIGEKIAHAWFQSMTFRTAGFNTVDHETLKPATKLLAIFLMFIGGAPGSTAGGVKVMVLALAVLRIGGILQGRQRIEFANRVISDEVVNRALTILALGMVVTMTTTMLLVIFEHDETRFLDHLYEATSAFATVGVSSITTSTLQPPSQIVLIVTMFLGRVGPLTVLLGLAGQTKEPNYDYPAERVILG